MKSGPSGSHVWIVEKVLYINPQLPWQPMSPYSYDHVSSGDGPVTKSSPSYCPPQGRDDSVEEKKEPSREKETPQINLTHNSLTNQFFCYLLVIALML